MPLLLLKRSKCEGNLKFENKKAVETRYFKMKTELLPFRGWGNDSLKPQIQNEKRTNGI